MKTHGLKPCPFCGVRPAINTWHEGEKTMYIVECENDACAIKPMTDYHVSLNIIVQEWNRRSKDEADA